VILPVLLAFGIVSAVPSGASAYVYFALWTMDVLTPPITLALRVVGGINVITFFGSWIMREPLMWFALFISSSLVLDSGTTHPQIKYGPISDADAKAF